MTLRPGVLFSPHTESGAVSHAASLVLPMGKRYLANMPNSFDPDLLYVECAQCGHPILWEPGRTAEILRLAGIDLARLDERCCILSEGCPVCRPDESQFSTQVVRLGRDREDGPEERRRSVN